VASAATLISCGADAGPGAVKATKLIAGPVAPTFTALPAPPAPPASPALELVYADPAARTIATALATLSADGGAALEATVLDRIAEGADTSADFGSHAYARFGDAEYLAYLDRAADGRLALKALTRRVQDDAWEVDVIDPARRPLCFLASGPLVHLILADQSALLDRPLAPGRPMVAVSVAACPPSGSVSVVRSPDADELVYACTATGRIVVGTARPDVLSVAEVTPPRGLAASGVLHARRDAQGRLDVLFYDERSEDIVDLLDVGGSNRLVRVTRAREVTAVWAESDSGGTTYLYAETIATGAGRPGYALSLLRTRAASDSRPVYRRLQTGTVPCAALQASTAGAELRVVVLTDSLTLLRVPLPGR
jgi:hypothetical protein